MNDLLQNLLRLQALEFGEIKERGSGTTVEELRRVIPAPILGHFDRLVVRGKKGVAIVRNQVCTGCHMRLPIGTINTLMQAHDIQLCDTCGRYLYLPDAGETEFLEKVEATRPAAKPRKRKTPAHAPA